MAPDGQHVPEINDIYKLEHKAGRVPGDTFIKERDCMAKMSQYENYKTEGGTPYSAEEQATFESTGVVPVSGKYHDGDTDMVTKTIGLDEIISSGFPAHTQSDAGKVLGVRDDGELEWVEKLPEHGFSDKDKVLTVTGSHGDAVEWVTPGGGGGGGNIVIAKVILQDADDEYSLNFISGTHTVKQIYEFINAGETVVNVQVTILNVDNSTSEIDMLSCCSIKPGMGIHDVFLLGAAGSGSFSENRDTAMLIGSWYDDTDDGTWSNFNNTPINSPEAEPAGE